MSGQLKNQQHILNKLSIEQLNAMQEKAIKVIDNHNDVVLLSPTGTGKTLAFLLPILKRLDRDCPEVQVLILVPSRELAIQIEQVIREMGTGFKANAFYGGQAFSKDKLALNHPPAILVGTPGRIADHIRRETFAIQLIHTLVLDEFDKSLEVGFEMDMSVIIEALPAVEKKILTSATQKINIPQFVGVKRPAYINWLEEETSKLKIKTVLSASKDKLDTLTALLAYVGPEPGIIFCNYKETIQFVSDHLNENGIDHGCFFGGMEQKDRERVLIKFRNGTHKVLLSTDLAARGLDIPELAYIIHFQLPFKEPEFTHRNGRTARMHSDGTAYVLKWDQSELPDYYEDMELEILDDSDLVPTPVSDEEKWQTLFISGGRKDKISKGDIAGLFFKQGQLEKIQLGNIELKQDCAFVGVQVSDATALVQKLNNSRLKKKKVRISII